MIQFNLLPDVKLEYIRTTKTKRSVITIASIIAGCSVGLLLLLFFIVNVVQKQQLHHLNSSIKSNITKLQETPDLDKVLTIQNQLGSLPKLHDDKPVSSRFFAYLSQLTPTAATISEAKLDYDAGTITVNGAADSLTTVNKYVDTIKFTEYTVGSSTDKKKAFSDVVLSEFGKNEKGVTYKIDYKFDPIIFSGADEVKLIVPNIVSTRSNTEKPTELFQQAPATEGRR
jgi:hypothetical protein